MEAIVQAVKASYYDVLDMVKVKSKFLLRKIKLQNTNINSEIRKYVSDISLKWGKSR